MKSWMAITLLGLFAGHAGPLQAASLQVGVGMGSLTATIAVDTHHRYQIFEGFGGDYANGRFHVNAPDDSVGEYNLEHLNPVHARVGLPLIDWEPLPGAADGGQFDWTSFKDEGSNVHNTFLLMQDLQGRHIPLTVSI